MLIEPVDPEVEQEAAEWIAGQAKGWGYVPNYAAVFASRPDVARAWSALGGAVSGAMDRRRFEVATIAAARALGSTYCTAAHSKFLRDVCEDETTMLALARGEDELDQTDRAIVTFAEKVARDAASIRAADVDALRAVGLSDNDIADIVFAVGARCFFATVLDAFGTQADHQLGDTFTPDVRDHLVVGRPIADAPSGS